MFLVMVPKQRHGGRTSKHRSRRVSNRISFLRCGDRHRVYESTSTPIPTTEPFPGSRGDACTATQPSGTRHHERRAQQGTARHESRDSTRVNPTHDSAIHQISCLTDIAGLLELLVHPSLTVGSVRHALPTYHEVFEVGKAARCDTLCRVCPFRATIIPGRSWRYSTASTRLEASPIQSQLEHMDLRPHLGPSVAMLQGGHGSVVVSRDKNASS